MSAGSVAEAEEHVDDQCGDVAVAHGHAVELGSARRQYQVLAGTTAPLFDDGAGYASSCSAQSMQCRRRSGVRVRLVMNSATPLYQAATCRQSVQTEDIEGRLHGEGLAEVVDEVHACGKGKEE